MYPRTKERVLSIDLTVKRESCHYFRQQGSIRNMLCLSGGLANLFEWEWVAYLVTKFANLAFREGFASEQSCDLFVKSCKSLNCTVIEAARWCCFSHFVDFSFQKLQLIKSLSLSLLCVLPNL